MSINAIGSLSDDWEEIIPASSIFAQSGPDFASEAKSLNKFIGGGINKLYDSACQFKDPVSREEFIQKFKKSAVSLNIDCIKKITEYLSTNRDNKVLFGDLRGILNKGKLSEDNTIYHVMTSLTKQDDLAIFNKLVAYIQTIDPKIGLIDIAKLNTQCQGALMKLAEPRLEKPIPPMKDLSYDQLFTAFKVAIKNEKPSRMVAVLRNVIGKLKDDFKTLSKEQSSSGDFYNLTILANSWLGYLKNDKVKAMLDADEVEFCKSGLEALKKSSSVKAESMKKIEQENDEIQSKKRESDPSFEVNEAINQEMLSELSDAIKNENLPKTIQILHDLNRKVRMDAENLRQNKSEASAFGRLCAQALLGLELIKPLKSDNADFQFNLTNLEKFIEIIQNEVALIVSK